MSEHHTSSQEHTAKNAESPDGPAVVEDHAEGKKRFEDVKLKIERLFNDIDIDKDHFIDHSEFVVLFSKMNAPLSFIASMADDEMVDTDVNGDGRISFEEYSKHILSDLFEYQGDPKSEIDAELHFAKFDKELFEKKVHMLEEQMKAAERGRTFINHQFLFPINDA